MKAAIGLATLIAAAAACEEFPVQAPVVADIDIVAPRTTLLVGETARFSAVVRDLDGEPVGGATVRWRSFHPDVAEVDASGVVTGVASGTATIVAESGGREATVAIAVEPRAARLEIVGRTTVVVGDTVLLAARIESASGEPVVRPVRWASLDFDVALVAKNGSVRGVAPGTAPVVARLEGVADTVDVRVVEEEETPDRP